MGFIQDNLDKTKFQRVYLSDKARNEIILKGLLEVCPEASFLLNDIKQLARVNNFKLDFNIINRNYGFTMIDSNVVTVNINDNHDSQKLRSIILHELGESHYIVTKHPRIISIDESYNRENKLTEMLSHYHIKLLMREYGLTEIENYDYPNIVKKLSNLPKDIQETGWSEIVRIVWGRITFEDLFTVDNSKYENVVHNITEIITSLDFLDPKQYNLIKINVNEILDILADFGFCREKCKLYNLV